MRRSLLFFAAATLPVAGLVFFASLAKAADQPANPPKGVAPPEAGAKVVGPRPVAPKAAPPKENLPREAAPKEASPARPTTDNPQSPATRETARDPRDTRPANRDPRAAPQDPRAATRDSRRENRRTDRDLGLTFGRVTDRGLALSQLAETSALYKSGLRSGDYVVSVNDHRLTRADDFDRYVYDGDANARIKVIVFRNGREEVVYLEPTVFYGDDTYNYDDDYKYFGVTFDDRYPDRLIVRNVIPNTAAYAAGLRDGDEITTWHGTRVANARDFGLALHSVYGGTVDFEYLHDSKPARAEARFSAREAAPAPEAREPAREAPAPATPAPTTPAPTTPAPATPAPAAPAPPAVTPVTPTAPAPTPAPAGTPQLPGRPGLIRGR